MPILYRARQFLRSMTAQVHPHQRQAVATILSPELATLFFSMAPADQVHSLRVLQDLIKQGEEDADLLAAALLHDVGKSRCPLSAVERAVIVLANRTLPQLVNRLGRRPARGPLRAFSTAVQHPAWGAEMAAKAGGSSRLCTLIRFHQDLSGGIQGEDLGPLLQRLQQADNRH
ncbi:MAG: HD domain-containing protein [Anaerolineales bacterium]|jgi:hypothetical protein